MLPAALMAGACAQLLGGFDPARLSPITGAAIGAALGFGAAPCGLGAVALAGALRVARARGGGGVSLRRRHPRSARATTQAAHSNGCTTMLAYALLAAASAIVAWRHGDALVHPALALPLWVCAAAALFCAARHRRRTCATARIAPGLMLAGALIGAPPPGLSRHGNDADRALRGRALELRGGADLRARRLRAGALRDHVLPCRRGAGRRTPERRAALSIRDVAARDGPNRRSPRRPAPRRAEHRPDRTAAGPVCL